VPLPHPTKSRLQGTPQQKPTFVATSRARPSFLYVMYSMIMISIPFAVLWAFQPAVAARCTKLFLPLYACSNKQPNVVGLRAWRKEFGIRAQTREPSDFEHEVRESDPGPNLPV